MANQKVFNPFPGLRPFGAEEDYLFFGREDQTNELLQLLRTHRFIAVVGTSGSGKSSLVRAGVLPALYGGTMVGAGSQWETVVFRPGGDPLLNLARGLIDAELYDGEDREAPLRIRATLSRSRLGLAQAVEQSCLGDQTNLLIVVDQFEELFRFRDTTPEHQEMATAFVKLLLNAAADESQPIYVAITMRSDYLGDCAQIPGLAEAVNQSEYLIPKLTRDQRRDAIEKPTAVGGGKMSPALVQQLLNDVGDDADQLPILQHALMRIWDKWEGDHEEGESIGLRHYDLVGGLQSALSLHADEVFAELRDDALRDLAQRVFQAITEKGDDERGIRRPTRLDQLCQVVGGDAADVELVLDAYRRPGRTFLMPFRNVELTDDVVIDISHESLMRVWKRLKEWVEQESQSVRIYKRLSDTALLWREDKAGLYRDPDLQITLSWMGSNRPNAAWAGRFDSNFPIALEFLDSSDQAHRQAERAAEENRQRELRQAKELADSQERLAQEQAASARKFRRQFQISCVIAIIAVVASIAAFYSMSVARQNEVIAKSATKEAIESRNELGASYRRESLEAAEDAFAQGDLAECLSLLAKGYNRDTTQHEFVRQAMAYISQVNMSRLVSKTPLGQPAKQYIQISGNSGALGYVTADNVLHVLAPEASQSDLVEIASIEVAERVAAVFVDDVSIRVVEQKGRSTRFDRNSLATTTLGGTEGNLEGALQANSSDHVSFVDGKTLQANGSRVRLIEHASTGDVVSEFSIPAEAQISRVQLAEDGKTAFVVTENQGYLVYELVDTSAPKRQIANDSSVLFLTYLPLQNQYLTLESSGLLALTSPESEDLDALYRLPLSSVEKVTVSPEGTRIAISDAAGTLSVYSLVDGRPLPINERLAGVSSNDFVFEPAGLALMVIDDSNQLLVFNLCAPNSPPETFPIQVGSHSLTAYWSKVSAMANQKALFILYAQRNAFQEGAALCRLEIRRTVARPASSVPTWSDLELDNIEAKDAVNLFAYFRQVASFVVPSGSPPSHPDFSPFMAWLNRDASAAVDYDRAGQAKEAGRPDHIAERDPSLDVWDLILRRRLSAQLLSQSMLMPAESRPAEVATRYHLVKHLQKEFGIPDSPTFSQVLVQQVAKFPRLLEVRSQAYADQIHQGQPIHLTGPKLIEHWDGLAHCWELASPAISLKQTRRWPATNNQYIIWRGAHFSDYRLEFEIVRLNGNSGVDGRSILLDDLRDVFQANQLHPYLQRGWQADLVGSQSLQAGNFHGKVINDNYRQKRPLVVADRGQTVIVGQDSQPMELARSPNKDTVGLLKQMMELEKPTRVTIELRGNHHTFRYGELTMNRIYDCQDDRLMSGEIAIQAIGAGSQLTYEKFVLIPLGRDIVDAEVALSEELQLSDECRAHVMASRKQWYALAAFLETLEPNGWVAEIKREMNLSRRDLHRRLARAMIANDTDLTLEVIEELNDSELLNEIANAQVGDAGFGSAFGTPLMSGAIHGSTEVLKLLLQSGVSLQRRTGVYGNSVLDAACFGNHHETVKLLIEHGCDLQTANRNGYTALHEAAKWAGPEVVKTLLDAGVGLNVRNSRNRSPLEELATIKNSAFQFGDTEYARYAVSDRRMKVARVLMAAGVDPQARSNDRLSAVELASNAGDTELVDVLSGN
ncbi:MAG: ankyrin repeat domain-containing protein [Planctomycetota bacterium]|nr:ankyrin repeat domain-containing protein [Planctomycetota bacterium]